MIYPAKLSLGSCYYPLGNWRAVSLTQELPANQDADILLLGCGDARNVLFTCFADIGRKIDVTCCDNEPLVHARNVLLYSLMIDDPANFNIDCIWNIYFHWKIDKASLELLETQILKLLKVSNSIDEWHNSVYGSSIRFYDGKSLSCIRSHWEGFQLQNLPPSERKHRLSRMQAVIDEATELRKSMFGSLDTNLIDGLDIGAPVGFDTVDDVSKIINYWWEHGVVPSSAPNPTNLNPAFLYLPYLGPTLHYCLNPLHAFPLSTAYTPIAEGSVFCMKRKNASSTYHLFDCAKNHFAQWASALRKAIENKLTIRIFYGDALDFCLTLRNCQLTRQLHHEDENVAPLKFDVIDTSNLADYLGLLNVIAAASSVLKYHASSTIYMQMMRLLDLNLVKRLFSLFTVDACSMSLLLGLVSPDLFTNATNSFEKNPVRDGVMEWSRSATPCEGMNHSPSRLRWK